MPQTLKKVCDNLNAVLADGNVLYLKLRKFHWNLKGPDFMQFHRLFEEQYEALEKAIDRSCRTHLYAWRNGSRYYHRVCRTLTAKRKSWNMPCSSGNGKELLQDHESIVKSLRTAIDDCEEKI